MKNKQKNKKTFIIALIKQEKTRNKFNKRIARYIHWKILLK